jgi:hypothetical protein
MDWIDLAQDRFRLNIVMNVQGHKMLGHFLVTE